MLVNTINVQFFFKIRVNFVARNNLKLTNFVECGDNPKGLFELIQHHVSLLQIDRNRLALFGPLGYVEFGLSDLVVDELRLHLEMAVLPDELPPELEDVILLLLVFELLERDVACPQQDVLGANVLVHQPEGHHIAVRGFLHLELHCRVPLGIQAPRDHVGLLLIPLAQYSHLGIRIAILVYGLQPDSFLYLDDNLCIRIETLLVVLLGGLQLLHFSLALVDFSQTLLKLSFEVFPLLFEGLL